MKPRVRTGQRGVAILTAILLVALGTILAAAIAGRNAMTARRGAATFAFEHALLFAQGAEALAGYALKDDTDSGSNTDHRGERWANPYGPLEIVPGVVLEASLEDLNGRFNLNTLMLEDERGEHALQSFERLLQSLELEPRWAQLLADWLDADAVAENDGGEDNLYLSQDPQYLAPNGPITSVSELLALPGFGRERYLRLAPHVAALPPDAKFNSCAASPFVLDAYIPGQQQYSVDPADTLKQQAAGCYPDVTTYRASFPDPAEYTKLEAFPGVGDQSTYFRLASFVRIGTTRFALYSLLVRDSGRVKVMMRSYSPD